MARVELRGIRKSYGRTEVLHGIDLTIEEGSFVALLGPSGCGKTTLLRIVAGLEEVSAGRVRLGEQDVTDLPPEDRHIAMMFQSYALLPHMTVAENVRFPLRMRRDGHRAEQARRAGDALELVSLTAFADRMPRQLSGGQQQRVALARAIVSRPKVLLLDEPLSNLDARLREDMQVELIDLHRRLGLTTLFVTHDQDEALSLSDTVVLMNAGNVEQIGPPDEIYERPATPFAAEFIGSANLLDVAVEKRDGDWIAALPGAEIQVAAPTDGRVGRRRLLIRQEDVRLVQRDGHRGGPSLPVRIETRVYLGSRVRYIAKAGGQAIKALTSRGTDFRPGDEALAVWRPEDARVL